MIRKISDFEAGWKAEIASTLKVINNLTDESLSTSVIPGERTLGRITWHYVTSSGELAKHAGLDGEYTTESKEIPSVKEIAEVFEKDSNILLDNIKKSWTDDMLEEELDMYGEKWKKGFILSVIIGHLVHHRAQTTILMRKAGLKVPGVCGPSREEYSAWNMEAPE